MIDTDKSTVYREISRNKKPRGGYNAQHAHMVSIERKERFGHVRRFTPAMEKFIRDKMTDEQWSPKKITGYCRLSGIAMVSHERICQFIRADKENGGTLWLHTRHRLKHRKRPATGKQVTIKNKVSIEKRPDIVNGRGRYGDWEIDTIIGKGRRGAILTLTERKTDFLIMRKLPEGKQALPSAKMVVKLLIAYKNKTHTITSDNGTEFAGHEYIAKKPDIDFYFAHPYSSWERGLNEYTNKSIGQYIIKGADFDEYTDEYIMLIQKKINKRPREKPNFQTPTKIFFASLNTSVAVVT